MQQGDDTVERPDAPEYEAPAIAWEEPYEPVGFGLSCVRAPELGDACLPGPAFT